jgi:hypothetical protein
MGQGDPLRHRRSRLMVCAVLVAGLLGTTAVAGAAASPSKSAPPSKTALRPKAAPGAKAAARPGSVADDTEPQQLDNTLSAVSCADVGDCAAVGYYITEAGVYQTLIESSSGSGWSIVSSPDVPNSTGNPLDNQLNGVSCPSADDCMAVGNTNGEGDGTGVAQTLAEQWNGTSWTIVPSADEGTMDNLLTAVDCTSASNCVAVGWSQGSSQTLVERWNGTSWSIDANTPAGQGGYLASVSCADADDCMAVGFSALSNTAYTSLV